MGFLREGDRETLRSWMNELIRLPTYRRDGVNDDADFKSAVRDGFRWLEGWGKQRKFDVINWDNRVLEIRGGEGPEVGLAVHLDVVPFSPDDWNVGQPDKLCLRRGSEPVYYGRGVIDDKGPLAAILLAIDRLRESDALPVRFRLIVDSAEELGFERIRNFFEKTSADVPERTLVADGFFPMVAGEKGLLQTDLKISFESPPSGAKLSLDTLSAGDAYNQVPSRATAVLSGENYEMSTLREEIFETSDSLAVETSVESIGGNKVKVLTRGNASHAASPDKGLNATAGLLTILGSNDNFSVNHADVFSSLSETLTERDGRFRTDASGFGLEDDHERFTRGTTVNLGTVDYSVNDELSLGLDFRLVPSTSPHEALKVLRNWHLATLPHSVSVNVEPVSEEPPLLVDTDGDLPRAALEAYGAVRNDEGEPVYIGGRTHASALDNAFAFGCMKPDRFEFYGFHGADERVPEIELLETAEIYAETLEVYGTSH